MALFSVVELFGDLLISWLPLYYEAKIIFIIWLSLPQTRGAARIYGTVIDPWLRKNESQIDAHTEIVSQHLSEGVSHLRTASFGFIKTKSIDILTMSTQLVASANSTPTPTPLSSTTSNPAGAFGFESPVKSSSPQPQVPVASSREEVNLPSASESQVDSKRVASLRSRKK